MTMVKALEWSDDAIRLKIVGQSLHSQLWMMIDSVLLFSISMKSSRVNSLSFRNREFAVTMEAGLYSSLRDSADDFHSCLMLATILSIWLPISGFSLSSIYYLSTVYGSSPPSLASSSLSIL